MRMTNVEKRGRHLVGERHRVIGTVRAGLSQPRMSTCGYNHTAELGGGCRLSGIVRGVRRRGLTTLVLVLATSALLAGCGGSAAPAETGAAPTGAAAPGGSQVLLDAQRLTVLDQPLRYPKKGAAQVSSSIVTLEPGQETGWHRHAAPMYAYVLEGTITVEYDGGVVKDYPAGTALLEAVGTWHNGTNKGTSPARVLVVNMGAKGVKNTVKRP